MHQDSIDPGLRKKLEDYVSLLLEWNRGMNLIGRSTVDDAWRIHVADSLELLPFLERCDVPTVVDIGSGGGLPAFPLAIALPDRRFTVTEVDSKKLAFLQFTAKKLNLPVTVADLNKPFVLEESAAVTSRAYGSVREILDWVSAHVKNPAGIFLLKGRDETAASELAEAGATGWKIHPLERGCVLEWK